MATLYTALVCSTLLVAQVRGASQSFDAQAVEVKPPVMTRADIDALSATPHQRVDWNWFYAALNSAAPGDREGLLRRLITSPQQDLASEAAGYAIRRGDADLTDLIGSQIVSWSPSSQGGVLGSVENTRPVALGIPRALVEAALASAQSRPPDAGDPHFDAAGEAALIVGVFGTHADNDMLQKLVTRQPWSAGAWLALANAGAITPEIAQLGAAAYQDQTLNLLARVAAASALEPVDGRAAEFAVSQMQTYLTRFEHEGAAEMLPQVLQPHPAGKEFDDWVYWSKNATILRTLMVLRGSAVGPMVLKNLASANEHIRNVCAAIAAIRWPEQLLQATQGLFSDREWAGLMAATAIRHPELASRAQARTTPSQFDDAKAQIAKSGAWGISPFAGTIQVFWK